MNDLHGTLSAIKLTGDGLVPNNERLAVLHYRAVLDPADGDLASGFERLFGQNQWPAAWRSGILEFHHFHCVAHEALGIYSGAATVRLGGESGTDVVLRAGDVAVLPAGVGHKQLSSEGALGVVGAYPLGQSADMCRPDRAQYKARCAMVESLALPLADPVHGSDGPLMDYWRPASTPSS